MSAAAGWYPDPSGAPRERWWDGAQWTAYERDAPVALAPAAPSAPSYAAPAYAAQPYAAAPPAAYAATGMPSKVQVDTNTVWIWLAIVATVLPFATLFLIDWNGYLDAMLRIESRGAVADMEQWQLRTLGVSLLSWAAMGAGIVFSWLDWRELRRRGVPAPFHWAWSFFSLLGGGAAVYMIGRAVVLRRRTVSGGWPPLWVWIAVTVVGYAVTIAWSVALVGQVFSRLAGEYA